MPNKNWKYVHTASLFGFIFFVPLVLHLLCREKQFQGAWLVALGGIVFFSMVCGQGVTGRWTGVLIDERNVMSLSRFQMFMWTVLILSGYIAYALVRAYQLGHVADALDVPVPGELWGLMGISATSLVGSPLIIGAKEQKPADDAEVAQTFDLLVKQGDDAHQLTNAGQVFVNRDIKAARWSDMFTGEEVGNAAHLDVARLQMFFFTIVLGLGYAILLGGTFENVTEITVTSALPSLSQGMTMLVLISHGGYLTAKAVPHSQTGDTSVKPGTGKASPVGDATVQQPPMG